MTMCRNPCTGPGPPPRWATIGKAIPLLQRFEAKTRAAGVGARSTPDGSRTPRAPCGYGTIAGYGPAGGTGLAGRKAHLDGEPAVRPCLSREGSPMGGGDGLDDGEAESESILPAGALGAQALEGLEEPVHRRRRDHRPAVGHREDGL